MTAVISDSPPGARGKAVPRPRYAGDEVMCGREPERRIVRDLLRRAQQGAGGVVLVEGEPGIGKSMLLRDAVSEAAGHGFSLAAGAADQLGRALPFFALRTALGEPFARLTAGDPELCLSDAPQWWINRMRTHLEQRATADPVLVCLDDLQWASPATLAALRTLPRDLKHHPVAWLLARASTPHHDTEYLFGLLEKDGAARVTLAPLDQDAIAAMLIEALGAPPDQTLMDMAGGAAGNPSLLIELIRGLGDDKAVRVTGGRASLVSTQLPRRMHRVAQRRLDGLSKQGRHLLVTAAVLGSSFRLEDAAEMLGETPARLLPTVEEAMDTGLMTAADNAFSFRHELLRRAVGEMIPRPARNALHRQYGQILLSRGEIAAPAAGHFLQAAHPDDPASLADLDTAAMQTLRSAPQTAADLALRALELTPPTDPGSLSRAVAATEALTAAGRLDQADRLAHDTLAKPLPPTAEARLRCALSSVQHARGMTSDAAGQAEMVLAQAQLPHGLREEALTARLQALTGSHDGVAGPLADTILADPTQHDNHAVVAAQAARAVIAWDNRQISEAVGLLRDESATALGSPPMPAIPSRARARCRPCRPPPARGSRQYPPRYRPPGAARHPGPCGTAHSARPRPPGQRPPGRADAVGQAALATAETLGARVRHDRALRSGCDRPAPRRHRGRGPAHRRPARPDTAFPRPVRADRDHLGPGPDHRSARRPGRRHKPHPPCRHRSPGMPRTAVRDPAFAAWLVRTSLAAGDQPLAKQVTDTVVVLANTNPGFPALAAAAAHSQGLATRDAGLLTKAAAQHPDPWARASIAEDLAVLLANTAKDQAIKHLKTALDGYRQTGADRDQARIRRRLRELGVRRRHWARRPPGPSPAGTASPTPSRPSAGSSPRD